MASDNKSLGTGSVNAPLLTPEDDREDSLPDYEASEKRRYLRKSWIKRHRNAVIFHTLTILIYAATAVAFWWNSSKSCQKRLLFCEGQFSFPLPFLFPQTLMIQQPQYQKTTCHIRSK